MAVVDARCGEDFRFRRKIGRRKSNRPATTIPFDHSPAGAEGPAEEYPGLLDIAHAQQFPNSCRVDVSPFDLHLGYDRDRETQMRTPFREQTHGSFAVTSEMEVVADVDLDRTNALMNVVAHESCGIDLREFPIEGLGDHDIESQTLQRFDLLLEGVE